MIEVDDHVRLIHEGSAYHGRIGQATKPMGTSTSRRWVVKLGEGDFVLCYEYDLEKVDI